MKLEGANQPNLMLRSPIDYGEHHLQVGEERVTKAIGSFMTVTPVPWEVGRAGELVDRVEVLVGWRPKLHRA
jgi:hypothetical protein